MNGVDTEADENVGRRSSGHLRLTTLAVFVGLVTSSVGCGKGTYLVLHFQGASLPPLLGIRVGLTLTASDGTTQQDVGTVPTKDNTTPFSLPSSAAFDLGDHAGSLALVAEALDGEHKNVGNPASTSTVIRHAQTWHLTLDLGEGKASALVASPDLVDADPVSLSW